MGAVIAVDLVQRYPQRRLFVGSQLAFAAGAAVSDLAPDSPICRRFFGAAQLTTHPFSSGLVWVPLAAGIAAVAVLVLTQYAGHSRSLIASLLWSVDGGVQG